MRPNLLKEVDGKNYFSASDRLVQFAASGLAGVWAEETLVRLFMTLFDVRKHLQPADRE
jgi:hypothetical protein